MIILCRYCNNVINLTNEQLEKAKEFFAKMSKDRTINFKCPTCKNLLELKSEMIVQNTPQNPPPNQLNHNEKINITDDESHEIENKSKFHMYEFKSIYIPVDSVHEGEKLVESFDISSLQNLGKAGWEIKAVVPRTFSQTFLSKLDSDSPKTLTNSSICGGNVMGVHIIMQRIKE